MSPISHSCTRLGVEQGGDWGRVGHKSWKCFSLEDPQKTSSGFQQAAQETCPTLCH